MSLPAAGGAQLTSLRDQADDQLIVYGGMHLGVDTADLAGHLGGLDLAAEQAGAALDYARRGSQALEKTAGFAPRTGAGASWAAWKTVVGRADIPERIIDVARALRRAIEDYRRQEQELTNRFYLRSTVCPPGSPPGCAAPNVPWYSSIPGLEQLYFVQRLWGATAVTVRESLMNGRLTPSDTQTGYFLRESTAALLDYFGIDRRDSSVHTFAALIVPILTAGVSARVRVERVRPPVLRIGGKVMPGIDPVTHDPATDIEGIVRNVGALYPNRGGAEPGTIRVDRVQAADGSVSWQVLVPGTQSADAPWGGDVPNDWAANLQMFARDPSAASAAVVAAMRAAGVRPGEPVMVAGHSQGGLVAADLAADEQVRNEFNIASMVTIGSPVGHFDVPETVAALHLEHTDDLVAGLDDVPNPIAPNRTTIERDVTEQLAPWQGPGSVVTAHDIPAYTETGALADASNDPALREWLSASAQMLDPRAEVHSVYLRSERVH